MIRHAFHVGAILVIAHLAAGCGEASVSPAQADLSLSDIDEGEVASLEWADGSAPLSLSVGGRKTLSIRATFTDGSVAEGLPRDAVWFSENEAAVVLPASGLLEAKGEGSAFIHLTWGTFSLEREIVVERRKVSLESFSFHENSSLFLSLAPKTLTLDFSLSDGSAYTGYLLEDALALLPCLPSFESSRQEVAVVTQEGRLSPTGEGKASIKAQCGSMADTHHVESRYAYDESQITDELESISIVSNDDIWTMGESVALTADLMFASGPVAGVGDWYVSPAGLIGRLRWDSSDSSAVEITEGVARLVKYGPVKVTAADEGVEATREMHVHAATELSLGYDDSMLSEDDDFDIDYGTNGGSGSAWFPEIVLGLPWTGGTDVVSLGGGGSLLVTLNDYIIADGPGVDFTIFENAVVNDAYGNFKERARVSVSADGETFYAFDCDEWDEAGGYPGCAGVASVNALNSPLDPLISGGDQYDLAEIPLEYAQYILIEDLETCVEDDSTYPLCAMAGTQGFDLDALAIVNGRYE